MPNVDLDNEFLEMFYKVTQSKLPQNINNLEMKKQMAGIIDLINELNVNSKKSIQNKALADESDDEPKGPAILVVDDLGVITYQLKVLLSKYEYDIDCSQEIYDAVNKYKKRNYEYVVMDLFIPTEREGFILLTELKKMAAVNDIKTIVGVITASPRKEIEQQCRARGADFFLEKNNDWQSALCDIMDGYINTGKESEDDY